MIEIANPPLSITAESVVNNYNLFARSKSLPESLHLYPNGKRFYGEWDYGQNFKNISEYKGAYSIQDLVRIKACIPDMGNLLHVFSGSIPAGPYSRLDNNFAVIGAPVPGRDVVGDASEAHLYFEEDSFDVVMADPPWSKYHSEEIYNCSLVDKTKVMKSLFRVLKPGGMIIWKDFSKPIWSGTEFDYLGRICIDPSSGHDDRSFKFFKKKEFV